MSFNSFLENIFGVIPNILTWCNQILTSLMGNYVFMIIIYIGIIIIIINVIQSLIGLIMDKTNKPSKDKED